LNPEAAKVNDRGKKQVPEINKQPRVVKGASSSDTLCYVHVVPPPTVATIDATATQADVHPQLVVIVDAYATQVVVPPTAAATTDENVTQFVVPTTATTNENVTQSVPHRDVAAGSFRHILQDVSDAIPQGTLPRPDIPVLELAATVQHDNMQKSLEAATLTVTSNEKVHSVPTVSVPPFEHVDVHDDVDDTVSQNREGSPISASKGANEPLDLAAVHMPSQDMRPPLPVNDPMVIASSEQQEVHPSMNIQHGLDLWNRVREYDARSAAEDFSPVLTRKQKQKIKLQRVLAKQSTNTRSRGGNLPTAP